MSKLYVAVTADKYELPIAVSESIVGLARMMGVDKSNVYRALYRAKKEGYRPTGDVIYKEVEDDGTY